MIIGEPTSHRHNKPWKLSWKMH